MSAEIIQVDYELLEQISKRFEKLNEKSITLKKLLLNQKESLINVKWEGKGAKNFNQEFSNDVNPALLRLSDCFMEAGLIVSSISKTLSESEDTCLSYWNQHLSQNPNILPPVSDDKETAQRLMQLKEEQSRLKEKYISQIEEYNRLQTELNQLSKELVDEGLGHILDLAKGQKKLIKGEIISGLLRLGYDIGEAAIWVGKGFFASSLDLQIGNLALDLGKTKSDLTEINKQILEIDPSWGVVDISI